MLNRTLTIGAILILALLTVAAAPPDEAPAEPGGMDDATRALYDQLQPDVQSDITDNIVPGLVAGWQGLTPAQVQQETTEALAFVVGFEHDVQIAMSAAASASSRTGGTVSCTYKTRLGSSTQVIYAGHISSCGGTMYAIKSAVRLKGPNYDPGWTEATINLNNSRASSYDSSTYSGSALWKAWGSGTAYPHDDGPLPSPDGGDCQIFETMPGDTETCPD